MTSIGTLAWRNNLADGNLAPKYKTVGPYLLSRGDGYPDVPDRAAAGLRDHRAGGADRAVQGPSVGGKTRVRWCFWLSTRRRPPRVDGCIDIMRSYGRHPARLRRGRSLRGGHAYRNSQCLRLAHSVPARTRGGDRRLRPAPACARKFAGGAGPTRPIVETLHDHWRVTLAIAGLSVFFAAGFYVSFVYLVSWLQTADGIVPAPALLR